jgi:hypothetical protein
MVFVVISIYRKPSPTPLPDTRSTPHSRSSHPLPVTQRPLSGFTNRLSESKTFLDGEHVRVTGGGEEGLQDHDEPRWRVVAPSGLAAGREVRRDLSSECPESLVSPSRGG